MVVLIDSLSCLQYRVLVFITPIDFIDEAIDFGYNGRADGALEEPGHQGRTIRVVCCAEWLAGRNRPLLLLKQLLELNKEFITYLFY